MERENILGLLRIKILRGINLARRDLIASDPYIIVSMSKQKLRTRVVKRNLNPVWNEELTLVVSDPDIPVRLRVYDKDTFSRDDPMGEAEFSIKEFVDAQKLKLQLENFPNGIVVRKVMPNRENCLSGESKIKWEDDKVSEHMFLRLRNVECGEIELELNWVPVAAASKTF